MTINGEITQLVMMTENSMMPNIFRPALNKVIETISELEPEPHWIPCSERLPEDDVYVLISKKPSPISGNKFSVTIGVRYTNSRSHKTEWRDSGFGYLSDEKVLAWMPLPSPYREEADE